MAFTPVAGSAAHQIEPGGHGPQHPAAELVVLDGVHPVRKRPDRFSAGAGHGTSAYGVVASAAVQRDWDVDADDLVAMGPAALAQRILRDIADESSPDAQSGLLGSNERYPGRGDVSQAVTETWAWLLQHGLVASAPGNVPHYVFVTSLRSRSARHRPSPHEERPNASVSTFTRS